MNFENCDYCEYFNRISYWCKYYNEPVACNMNLIPLGCEECRRNIRKDRENESKN